MSVWTYGDEARAVLGDIVATIKRGDDPSAYVRAAERALAGYSADAYNGATFAGQTFRGHEVAAYWLDADGRTRVAFTDGASIDLGDMADMLVDDADEREAVPA